MGTECSTQGDHKKKRTQRKDPSQGGEKTNGKHHAQHGKPRLLKNNPLIKAGQAAISIQKTRRTKITCRGENVKLVQGRGGSQWEERGGGEGSCGRYDSSDENKEKVLGEKDGGGSESIWRNQTLNISDS